MQINKRKHAKHCVITCIWCWKWFVVYLKKKKFEDTKGVIRNTNRRTYILMAKKDKRTNNELQSTVISGGLQMNANYFKSIWQETIKYSLIWKESLSSYVNHFHQFLYTSSFEIIWLLNFKVEEDTKGVIRNTNRRTYILMAKKDKRTNNELQSTIRKTKEWEINVIYIRRHTTCYMITPVKSTKLLDFFLNANK
jgi:hypothetical protein